MKTATSKDLTTVAISVVKQTYSTLTEAEAIDKALRGDFPKSSGGTVYAEINHGRWLADCPCGGAELVTPNEPMLCGSCGTEHAVVFPEDFDVHLKLLSVRPQTKQNWRVGETSDDLLAENIREGLGGI